MFKKLVKIAAVSLAVLIIAAVAGFFVIRHAFPPEKIKTMVVEYTQKTLHREITFDRVSFNWIGITLNNFAISEADTFEQGTFIKADRLIAKVDVKPLLRKRIEISRIIVDGLDIQLIKNKDGSFNFDSLLSKEQTPEENAAEDSETSDDTSMVVLAKYFAARNCSISYQDLASDFTAHAKQINITMENFDLAAPFHALLAFTAHIPAGPSQQQIAIPVETDLTVFLDNLNLPNAYVTLNKASAAYQKLALKLKGGVKNFAKPEVDLSGTLTGVSDTNLAVFAPDLPKFTVPDISLIFQAVSDLDAGSVSLNQATITVLDNAFSVGGYLSWANPSLTYNMKGTLKLNLEQFTQMADLINDFRPAGSIEGTFQATDKKDFQDVSGVLTLKDLQAVYDNLTLSALNGKIDIKSPQDVSAPALTALLNNEKTTASFSYQNIRDVMNIVCKLHVDKIKLTAFPGAASATDDTAAQRAPAAAANDTPSDWRMNLKADLSAGEIEVPYFKTSGMVINADLTDITPRFDQANGKLSFDIQPGAITNLDSVLGQNKIVKIILLPLSLVKKVAGILKIDLFPTDKSDSDKGSLSFTEGAGEYTFTDGLMNIEKTIFKSKVTDISGNGTINFKTEELDMKMKASVTTITQGTPMVIKITGTISDPKGKLDVLNTVGSVVGGILTGKMVLSTAKTGTNVAQGAVSTATDTVKGTVKVATGAVKALGGLFKKSSATAEEPAGEQPQTAAETAQAATETAEAAQPVAAETPAAEETPVTPAEEQAAAE